MVFNVTPFQPDPALAGPWEADVTGDLFWYFQNESDCAKYTSNCSDHGQCHVPLERPGWTCRCLDLYDASTFCNISFFQIWDANEHWFIVWLSIINTILVLLVVVDFVMGLVKKTKWDFYKYFAKLIILLFCVCVYLYLGFFIGAYNLRQVQFVWPRTIFLQISNLLLGILYCIICLFWVDLATKVLQVSSRTRLVSRVITFLLVATILALGVTGVLVNLVTLEKTENLVYWDTVQSTCFLISSLLLTCWSFINGVYFYRLFRKVPEAQFVNYKNITLIVLSVALLMFAVIGLIFYRINARAVPKINLGCPFPSPPSTPQTLHPFQSSTASTIRLH